MSDPHSSPDLRHGLDGAPGGYVPDRHLTLCGWCFDAGGDELKGVRVRVGDATFKASRKQTRWPVAQRFPDFPQARKSGFTVEIALPKGASTVVLEARTSSGEWHGLEEIAFQTPRFRLLHRLIAKPDRKGPRTYTEWADTFESPDPNAIATMRDQSAHLAYRPLVSFVLPTYNPAPDDLRACLDSLLAQAYDRFEICIADDASTDPAVRKMLKSFAGQHADVHVAYRESNGHISAATNSALELATGEFIALVDHDDVVPPHALFHIVAALQDHRDAILLYSDEDKITREGSRAAPHFKPDFDPDLLRVQNCISHLGVFRRDAVLEAGAFRPGFEGSQDWDLALRVTGRCRPDQVVHVPRILYHWRAVEGGTSDGEGAKPYTWEAAERAVQEHLERGGNTGATIERRDDGTLYVRYPLPDPAPRAAIIIPTRDQPEVLELCLRSLARTSYTDSLTVLVDNGTTDPRAREILAEAESGGAVVIRDDAPFNFARLCNTGAAEARDRGAKILVFLNNDTEITDPAWLGALVRQAVRPEIGAVGARLLYPDGTLQHAGVFLGFGGAAGHRFKGMAEAPEHCFRRDRLAGRASAVTAACLAVESDKYFSVEGMDAEHFGVAYNDVDLCLRLAATGYATIYEPAAVLVHHESKSRGEAERSATQKARANSEIAALQETHSEVLRRDPFYSPNLSLSDEIASLAWPPAGERDR